MAAEPVISLPSPDITSPGDAYAIPDMESIPLADCVSCNAPPTEALSGTCVNPLVAAAVAAAIVAVAVAERAFFLEGCLLRCV